jgi:hypothetical protein
MKGELPSADLAVPTLRGELLEVLEFLMPDKRWPKRVPAREMADFATQAFQSHSVVDLEQRALLLAHLIRLKLDARNRK